MFTFIDSGIPSVGVLAQEVEAVLPELVGIRVICAIPSLIAETSLPNWEKISSLHSYQQQY